MSSVHDAPYPPTSTPDTAAAPTPHPAEQTIPNLMIVRDGTAPVPAPEAEVSVSRVAELKAKASAKLDPLAKKSRELVVPPDIVTKDLPSLAKIREYGRAGTAVPETGPLRAASKTWSWFAMYHAARGYLRAWLMQRPSRAAVFLALVVLAALIPATRVVLTVLLWPAHQVIELITNF
ncbi:hypothetical protein L3Q67_45110 (plasmid) [Saccharothrix sp. AJ9571]|nr:hypothetical protein L3Q67_45110 [Saccharothrix sp. AJ9571]